MWKMILSSENNEKYSEHQYYLLTWCRKSCVTYWKLQWNRFGKGHQGRWKSLKFLCFVSSKTVATLLLYRLNGGPFRHLTAVSMHRWVGRNMCTDFVLKSSTCKRHQNCVHRPSVGAVLAAWWPSLSAARLYTVCWMLNAFHCCAVMLTAVVSGLVDSRLVCGTVIK